MILKILKISLILSILPSSLIANTPIFSGRDKFIQNKKFEEAKFKFWSKI